VVGAARIRCGDMLGSPSAKVIKSNLVPGLVQQVRYKELQTNSNITGIEPSFWH